MATRHLLDNLHPGAVALTADGKHVGKLQAIVLDPRDDEVTHVVINAGPHFPQPGFGDPKLVSVDIDQVLDATEREVKLKASEAQFKGMPLYVERAFFPKPRKKQPAREDHGIHFWEAGTAIAASLASLLTGIAVPGESVRKASYERQILEDAPVWRSEPHMHLGDVERVLIDEDTDEIESLVIRRGALFHDDVVLPFDFVREVLDGVIHVDITQEELDQLSPYRGEHA